MANILPLKAQAKVWGMYRARFIIAASIVSLSLSLFAAIALVPSYLALELAAPPTPDLATGHHGSTPSDVMAIARAQALITLVSPLIASTSSPSAVILSVLAAWTQGISVEHITYIAQPAQITLAGSASREAISAYRDTLAKDPRFTAVSIPVGSLIGADNGFTISLSGTF